MPTVADTFILLSYLCSREGSKEYINNATSAMDPECWLGEQILDLYEASLQAVAIDEYVITNVTLVVPEPKQECDMLVIDSSFASKGSYKLALEVMLEDGSVHCLWSGYSDEREQHYVPKYGFIGITYHAAQTIVHNAVRSSWYPGCKS